MVEGEDSVVAELNKLKAAGLKLAIDDFGTGFCSLRYLTQFPVDVVKIDRSFVSDIGGNRQNLAIVEAVLAMCRSLDLVAVAEGIETEEQARTLRALGCPCGQGYLFGRPGPAEELTRLLNSPTRGMSLLAA
jgi:EAL domain-containing protein (putative c-di-GMP-specific phosphodiesterase class I)